MSSANELPKEIMDTLKNASSGELTDALALSGIKGGIMGIRPARGFEDHKIIGPAVTVLMAPSHPSTPGLNNYQIIRDSPPGSVLVIDGKGIDGHFTGDNQALCAKRQGLAAVAVFGGARDIAGFREVKMPLYCTSPSTADKPSNFRPTACNVPVEIGGVLVRPGDVVVGDEDGLVAIPIDFLDKVMENLRLINSVETDMQKALKNDAPLEELLSIISRKKPK